jgi:predicted metal-binding membrane protein
MPRLLAREEQALMTIPLLAWAALLAAYGLQRVNALGAGAAMQWCSPQAMAGAVRHPGRLTATAVASGLGMSLLMAAAAMLPATLPALHHVARNSLRRRRRAVVAAFLLGYLAVWTGAGALQVAAAAVMPAAALSATLLALLLAAVWELTPLKRAALLACHRSVPIPLWGAGAILTVFRFGLRIGCACVGSCWALMLISPGLGPAGLPVMAGVGALVWFQKRTRYPRLVTRSTAALLAGSGVLVGLLAGLTG